jgi:ribonuclease Z
MRESQSQANETDDLSQSRLRKIVVLGDTNSPAAMIPLINSSPGHVALLVHEATDCCIPSEVDSDGITGKHRTPESVCKVSLERGHSTPAMAGEFAKAIGAQRLFLNHLGGRFVFHLPLFP